MPNNLSGLKITPKRRSKEIDPEKIFAGLTLRGGVENIWGPQAEALHLWHEKRDQPEVVLEMNTGGGKTLIGLLIAQSITNETSGQVLYVCPTNQLIEQAKLRADECSLQVATYMKGKWQDESVFREGRGPCLTNYAAVFNGKSIFRTENLAGLLLDDAHVAGSRIRSNFTLKIDFNTQAFNKIVALFRPYIERSGRGQELGVLLSGDRLPLFFIPAHELNRYWQQLTKILVEEKVDEKKSTMFAWEYLRDKINRCCVLVSASGIEITPVSLPLHELSQFADCKSRIYLTATLPSPTQFVQTFGVSNPTTIRPGGKSGEAQRLFVFAIGDTDDEQRDWAKKLLEQNKVCIIAPSSNAAEAWDGFAPMYNGDTGQAGLEIFKKAAPPQKLVMAARYDGIDLPGQSCRILILDGLPTGFSNFDRFLDQGVGLENLRSSSTAIRIIQAIGRIFRSNTDHGVVMLCGLELQNWVRKPSNQAYLPDLLQKQLQLGIQLREMVDKKETNYRELINGVLIGDRDWDRIYSDVIDEYDTAKLPTPPPWLIETVLDENEAFQCMWEGNYSDAVQKLGAIVDKASANDKRLAAWYEHWLGLAQERLGQKTEAAKSYIEAANKRSELGRPKVTSDSIITSISNPTPSAQANAIALLLSNMQSVHKRIQKIKEDLVYGEDTNPAEEALKNLGALLGLTATRPDTGKQATGPDVLWQDTASKTGVALEAKTNKKPESEYQKKDDIGQFHDHIKYLQDKHSNETFVMAIVGRLLPVSQKSNPPDNLRIVPLEGFQDLTQRVEELYGYLESSTDNDPAPIRVERWLISLGLNWPDCFEALAYKLAIDLKNTPPSEDDVY